MQKKPWRGRRPAVFVVCVVAAFVATATVLSVSVAATNVGTVNSSKVKTKPKSEGLTKAEVISLIKRYSTSGSTGATGPAGTSGPAGASGSAGAKGETGTKGETGEKGEKGENGARGAPGENGAVAGYSASQPLTGPEEGVMFTNGTAASPTAVLTKALPAGSYLASAMVQVTMVATDPGGEGAVDCSLADVPGSGSPVADVSGFVSGTTALIPVANLYVAETTLPMEVAVSSTSPSELAVSCWVNLGDGGENGTPGVFASEAAEAQIQAVQTTSNS
jgi:hypothetical protein